MAEALHALWSLSERAEHWLADLAHAQSTFKSLHGSWHTWGAQGGENRITLPLKQAWPLVATSMAEGPTRLDYVWPSTRPLLPYHRIYSALAENAHAQARALIVRPISPPAPRDRLQIRASRTELPEIVLVNDEFAFVPARSAARSVTVTAVRDELIVAQLAQFFTAAWTHAALPPVPAANPKPTDAELKARIVGMLADGAKDEAVARRLGVSLRTCRRYVAEIMEDLNASSRFQAGVRAGLAGMVLEQWPDTRR